MSRSDVMFLHTPHEKSSRVAVLQTKLKARRWYSGSVDGEFGPLTAQSVYRAKYWLGYLKPDHVAGPVLLAYLDGTKKTTPQMRAAVALRRRKAKKVSRGDALLREASTYLGTRESPPNSNIVLFSKWYGMTGSWCAMFCSYCLAKMGFKFHYAYVPYVVADARAGRNGLSLVHPSDLKSHGDDCILVCYDWNKDGVADHIGIFEAWTTVPGQFTAIEGNTGIGNDSNGGEVMRRERSLNQVQAFVKVTK